MNFKKRDFLLRISRFYVTCTIMLKHEGQTIYRTKRSRRTNSMYDNRLVLDGVTSKFGFIGIGVLLLVGIIMLFATHVPKENELAPINIEIQAPPYRTVKLRNSVLLPVTGARVLALEPATFAAADTTQLFALKKGETLKAYLNIPDATNWNNGVARKDFYKAHLLQKTDNSWLVNYTAYRIKALGFSSQGWWLILLGLILVPYQFIRYPKFSIWLALLLYGSAILAWNYLL